MITTFQAYTDSQHGWAKVHKSILAELGLHDKITRFSYMNGEFAYLECDWDLSRFVEAFEKKYGQKPIFKTHMSNGRSRIRNYPTYFCKMEKA